MLKVVITGSSSVGKTETVRRLKGDIFLEEYHRTSGVEYSTSDITVNDRKITLVIWDTSGEREDMPLTSVFLQGADVILLVFDITNKESFYDLCQWKILIQESVYPRVFPTDKQLILIGNKSDQEHKREVNCIQAADFAEEIGANFLEMSAKTGEMFPKFLEKLIVTKPS